MKEHIISPRLSVNEDVWDSLTAPYIIKYLLNQWMDGWMERWREGGMKMPARGQNEQSVCHLLFLVMSLVVFTPVISLLRPQFLYL